MKIIIEKQIKATCLNDINYIIDLVGKHTKLQDVINELEYTNFPTLGVGNGSSHIWVKQQITGSMSLENDRTLFIS